MIFVLYTVKAILSFLGFWSRRDCKGINSLEYKRHCIVKRIKN